MILLSLGAWAAPGVALLLLELAVVRSAKALRIVHLGAVGLLLSLILLPLVKRIDALPGAICVAVALAGGIALAVQYLRARTFRWSVVYLTPALLLFPAWLVLYSPVTALLWPGYAPQALRTRIGNPAPVVMVVFDEFPLVSLLDRDGAIEPALFPHFAELSRTSTWYRNATTVSDGTLIAVPAILDGRYPTPDHPRLPDSSGHPNSLFTMLGGTYHMNVVENNTRVCPERICGGTHDPFRDRFRALASDASVLWLYSVLPSKFTRGLPDISQTWGDFAAPQEASTATGKAQWDEFDELTSWRDRLKEFRDFTASVHRADFPTLHFLHILLPHAPWEYLPNGQRYPIGDGRIRGVRGQNDRGEDPNGWLDDSWAAAQSYQRHLLQVEMVDRLVGELLARLKAEGIYDEAMVVITADHGTSFRPSDSRRYVTRTNRPDIMSVPLFIKYPHQQAGGIDDRGAQTIDVLPTIARTLQVRAKWKFDGRPLAAANATGHQAETIYSDSGVHLEDKAGLEDLYESLRYKFGLFGKIRSEEDLFRLGDRAGWVGKPPAAAGAPAGTVELDRGVYYAKVEPAAQMLLTNVSGRIRLAQPAPAPHHVAVAVNGVVRAVAETYSSAAGEAFMAMVPRGTLRAGQNNVDVFLVNPSSATLSRLIAPETRAYRWGTRITFGRAGNAEHYLGIGWSGPEEQLHWTDGHSATVYLPVSAPEKDLTLVANLCAFTAPGKLPMQRVRVLVNQREVGTWELHSDFQEFRATIPRGLISSDAPAEITFDMPDAVAPIAIKVNNDSRTLGLAAIWMEIDQ